MVAFYLLFLAQITKNNVFVQGYVCVCVTFLRHNCPLSRKLQKRKKNFISLCLVLPAELGERVSENNRWWWGRLQRDRRTKLQKETTACLLFFGFFCSGAAAVNFFTAYGNKIAICLNDRYRWEIFFHYTVKLSWKIRNMHNGTCFNYHSERGILICFE